MSAENSPSSSVEPQPVVVAEVEECFNYAAWQNAVPLLRSVVVENPTDHLLSDITVELKISPKFARPKSWILDRIGANQAVAMKDIDIEVDAEYLDRLDEAVRGVLSFRLLKGEQLLAETSSPIRVLARDEWGGMSSMGGLIPAFVTPNDPALAPLLKLASESLAQHGHSSALDGYQSRDPSRSYMLAAALWSVVAAKRLTYANPPSSFEKVGQKTRRVATVLGDGLATCLDSTLLFASGLEAMGLNAIMVMTDGHCFAGVWLVEKTLKKLIEPDCSELRKAIAAKELIVFETTLVTNQPAASFAEAVASATSALAESREHEFAAAVDVARARMSQVRPLASHGVRVNKLQDVADREPPTLPTAPDYRSPVMDDLDSKPQTPAGRIDRWQRKLLDLSLRNRLLNFRPTKQVVPVICPEVGRLEDRLANGVRMRLVSLKDENSIGGRDAALHQQRTQKDLDLEFARGALVRDELACPIDARELESRLTTLFRKVKNDLAEGGSNTLYLAVGFLRWKQSPTDEKIYRAPLLLVPVKLLRRSASSPFYLTHHEDEVRINATLLQLLKKDFDCDLTSLESNLPTDDSGVDVPRVLERMRIAVRDMPGFEVIEEVAITTFSFAKYLMWKDLVDRVDQLSNNRVVRHLVHDPDKPFHTDGVSAMPRPDEIDKRYLPSDIVTPLPADSSQLAAVMAAAEGHDLVIVGPPGTGKSQTIANVIAQCLAGGKTVLFVAEKTAALDVVHRRLRNHGLGDCCVELHSNKADRRRLLEQLEASWHRRAHQQDSEWIELSNRLRLRRDELNAYVAAIHSPYPNGWTVYRAMGLSVRERETFSPELSWSRSTHHNQKTYTELVESIDDLALAAGAIPRTADLGRLDTADWSMAWETDFLATCKKLTESAEALANGMNALASAANLSLPADLSAGQLAAFYRLAHELTRPQLPPAALVVEKNLDVLKVGLATRRTLLEARERALWEWHQSLALFSSLLGQQIDGREIASDREPYLRLARELLASQPSASALVFHRSFDKVPVQIAHRQELLKQRDETWAGLEARGFSAALIKRLDLPQLETDWQNANRTLWPISVFRKAAVRTRLKSYMSQTSVSAPEVDLPLLREYQDCHDALRSNLADLELPTDFENAVENDLASLNPLIDSARRIRDAIIATGAFIESAGLRTQTSLEPLIAIAKRVSEQLAGIEQCEAALRRNLTELALPSDLQTEVEENGQGLDESIEAALRLRQAAEACDLSVEAVVRSKDSDNERSRAAATDACRLAKEFQFAWQEYARLAGITPVAKESTTVISDARAQATRVLTHRTQLKHWTAWVAAQHRVEKLGLGVFVEALRRAELQPPELPARFKLAYVRWWLPIAVDGSQTLRTFQRFQHEDAIADFQKLDDLSREAASPRALQAIYHDLPAAEFVPRQSELGLLRHQLGLKRPSKSIREMIAGMPQSFGKLAPCLLMSPLSIAQYLPASQAQFDVVVFDEASQIATWDAIGAIARGKQTIIVGDPKQLPPTNFFGRADDDEANEELGDFEKDLESILDEAKASGLPTLQLNWHYRSRHESLIAFSNFNYYGNHLVTFPAAETEDRGVSLQLVKEGIYDRGKSRTNRAEAEAIVADAVTRMRRCLNKPEDKRLTYGVVTFNSQQQSLIQDLFDQALRAEPELEWFFADERIEPTAVKNLENVQGDERDVMYFSITFGKDAAGKFPIDFGAINREGGERRLNVAVTRARQTLLVYASFLPDEMRAERSSARGVNDLKAFLEYAYRGVGAIVARSQGSVGEIESPFEEAVANELQNLGWQLDPQVGVSGFRVDLGVVHPDRPGAYLAGIECDGATYHRSAAARDRDKTRQQVLENLGWTIFRVWSPDWWYDSRTAVERLHQELTSALEASRQDHDHEEPSVEVKSREQRARKHDDQEANKNEESSKAVISEPTSDVQEGVAAVRRQLVAEQVNQKTSVLHYQVAVLDDVSENQSRFFDNDYSRSLRDLALAVLEAEAPIRDDLLVRRVARAHGFARTGARIKERVLSMLPEVVATDEDGGRFLWTGDGPLRSIPFRHAASDDERRNLSEIPMAELLGLICSRPDLAVTEDPALAFAREIGLGRLSQPARDRLEEAIEIAVNGET